MAEATRTRPDTTTVVRTKDVTKVYVMGKVKVPALKGVTLDIQAGEYISIMGPSGSGKSTLFNMIGGLDKPTGGFVYIDEVDVAQLDAYELAWLRCRKIGYIFQTFNLIPVMSALENVTLPMTFAGMTTDEARDKGMGLLARVGLAERYNHKPSELSAASSSASPSPAPWPTTRASSSPTSPPATSTSTPARRSSTCSKNSALR